MLKRSGLCSFLSTEIKSCLVTYFSPISFDELRSGFARAHSTSTHTHHALAGTYGRDSHSASSGPHRIVSNAEHTFLSHGIDRAPMCETVNRIYLGARSARWPSLDRKTLTSQRFSGPISHRPCGKNANRFIRALFLRYFPLTLSSI